MTDAKHLSRLLAALASFFLVSSTVSGCAGNEEQATEPSGNWVGLANDVSRVAQSDSHNALFSIESGKLSQQQLLPPVYFPAFQRYKDGYITPTRDGILFLDSDLNEVKREAIPQLGLPTQSTTTASANNANVLWSFNIGTEQIPYQHVVVAVTTDQVHTLVRKQHIDSSRICNDGTSQWIEESARDSSTYALVTLSPHGDVVEKEFRIPPHHDVVTVSSYLGCGQEDSFLVLRNNSDETTVATLDKESAQLSADRRSLDSVPLNWLARTSFVRDEKLFQFTDKAQLATIDFKNSSVTYSDALLPPHQRAVNLTFDNDEFYVVSQPQDGGPELEVRTYSLESPALKEKGEQLGSMSSLLGNSASSAHPYVIPLAIYPRDPR